MMDYSVRKLGKVATKCLFLALGQVSICEPYVSLYASAPHRTIRREVASPTTDVSEIEICKGKKEIAGYRFIAESDAGKCAQAKIGDKIEFVEIYIDPKTNRLTDKASNPLPLVDTGGE